MILASAPTKMPSRELVAGGTYALFAALGIVMVCAVLPAAHDVSDCGGLARTSSNQAYEIAKSVEVFKLVHARYPTAEEGLGVLVTPPKGGRAMLDALPKDAWGNDYAYVRPGVMNREFDVRSAGADAVFFTDDDVGNWRRE